MKRKISILLILFLTFTTLVFAAGSPRIEVESRSVVQGSQVNLTVSVKENTGVGLMVLIPEFPNEFELVSAKAGKMFELTSGKNYVLMADRDVTSDGTILDLTFDVGNAKPGEYKVGFKVGETVNYDEEDVNIFVTSGTVTVLPKEAEKEDICKHESYIEDSELKYPAFEADCEHPEMYYKVCESCGERGTETFTYGEALGHDFGEAVTVRNEYGKFSDRTCGRCGYIETVAIEEEPESTAWIYAVVAGVIAVIITAVIIGRRRKTKEV